MRRCRDGEGSERRQGPGQRAQALRRLHHRDPRGQAGHGLARMSAALLDERQHQRIAEMRTLKLNEIREAWVDDMTREALAGV